MQYIKLLGKPAHVFQIAYVTRNIEKTVESLMSQMGLPSLPILSLEMNDENLGSISIKAACAYIGETMIELIEPIGGADGIYRDYFPNNGQDMRLHHFGYYIKDRYHWDALTNSIYEQKVPIVLTLNLSTFDIIYTDHRKEIGHYLEFCFIKSDGMGRLNSFPRY